jgi:D-galactarolactone isomerase
MTFPQGACDTHVHIYDKRYPTAPGAVVLANDASVADYVTAHAALGIGRVVVVQPSAYGLDNRCQTEALAEFAHRGIETRGVMVVDRNTAGDELRRLDRLGVRGARFHMLPGGAVGWDELDTVAATIAPLGWHIQLQLNGRELPQHLTMLRSLPCPLVVDHIGRFMPPVAVESAEFAALVALLDTGRTWVKISAPYESSADGPPDYPDVATLVDELVARFPDRLLWASNWPHPSTDPSRSTPSAADLADLAFRWFPEQVLHRVMVDNPAVLYGF